MAKIAFVVADDYEDSEFRIPYRRLGEAGHDIVVAGTEAGSVLHGKRDDDTIETDIATSELDRGEFDALVIPGGYSPDKLRLDEHAVRFTRAMVTSGKTVAAICHAGWMLAEAGVLEGLTVTSWPSIRTDLENAGATWVDRPVVEESNLITSRKPDDLDAFCETILHHLEQAEAA